MEMLEAARLIQIESDILFSLFHYKLDYRIKKSEYEIWNRISFSCHMRLDFTFSPFFFPVQDLFSKIFVSV